MLPRVLSRVVGADESPSLSSYGPLYTALTTGFCGSLTTFSGWQYDIFSSWLNPSEFHRDWFRDVRIHLILGSHLLLTRSRRLSMASAKPRLP